MFVCPICRGALSDEALCPSDGVEAVEVDETLLPPHLGDRFGILDVYGGGDLGSLYKAFDPETSTWGLLKLMKLSDGVNDAGRQRLTRDLERQIGLPSSPRTAHPRRAAVE